MDTNILVRAAAVDDERQSEAAVALMAHADLIAIPLPALCEFVWVMSKAYRNGPAEIAASLRKLLAGENVVVNRPAVEAGLAMLDAGGDFADGVIAYEGRWLGAESFVSFDRRAVKLLMERGEKARLLS